MRGYLSLIQSDSITHMHGLTVYVKEGLHFVGELSLENCMYSYLSGLQFDWLYFCLSYSPLLYPSPSSSLCMAFDSVSSNLEGLLLIIQSANVFVFGDFNVHPKDWLTYSGRTDILVNSVITFLSQTTLLRWLTFLLGSLTGTLTVLLM